MKRYAFFACIGWLMLITGGLILTLSLTDGALVFGRTGAEIKILNAATNSIQVMSGSRGVIAFSPLLLPAFLIPLGLLSWWAWQGLRAR